MKSIPSALRLLNPLNDFMFCIALKALHGMAGRIRLPDVDSRSLDGGEVGVAIDTGFAATQQIEIRAIDQEEGLPLSLLDFASFPKMAAILYPFHGR